MMSIEHWEEYFNFSPIEIGGKTYQISLDEIKHLKSTSNYWHGKSSPSSWLTMNLFNHISRHEFKTLTERTRLQIAAHLLDIPLKKVIQLIEWNDGYMNWHEGGGYQTLEDDHSDVK